MMRSSSPAPPRSISPAMSEISVGSPSPPPAGLYLHHATAFRPLNMKRIRLESPPTNQSIAAKMAAAAPLRRKSSAERIKSFSIADILGRRDEVDDAESQSQTIAPCPLIAPPAPAPAPVAQPQLHIPAHLLHGPMHMRPFFPPALLQYEQRLAWDYQRQLQEHFHAQAQLLRQMSLDPAIIPSEDGSERSRSSSTGSDCCSPEVNVSNDDGEARTKDDTQAADSEKSARSSVEATKRTPGDTPLDALFQLSTKNFDEEQDPATLNIFATRPNPKKKRKSRTAFTNHQIFELEKRFLYQKYLSPADRDEIAGGLGLSNAQVITWFQNRRAKLKRDMEELKKDVESVKQLSAHKSFLENVNDFSILKTRPVSRHQQPQPQPQPHPQPSPSAACAATCPPPASSTPPTYVAADAVADGGGAGGSRHAPNESSQNARLQLNISRG